MYHESVMSPDPAVPQYQVDAPLPKIRHGVRDEIEYWAIHVNDGQPGSDHCLQIESRLVNLRHLEQVMVHEEKTSATSNGQVVVFISHHCCPGKLSR
jgi:hypothetical protein